MIRLFALSMIAVSGLAIASFASGDFAPCSIDQLSTALATLADYAALEDRLPEVETLDDLISFRDLQLRRRDAVWKSLPRCAESIELGELLSKRYGLFAAMRADHFLAMEKGAAFVGSFANPYSEPFFDATFFERYRQLWNDVHTRLRGDADSTEADGALRMCRWSELGALFQAVNEYLLLLESFSSIKAYSDMARYGSAQVNWSDELRSRLPSCKLAFESSILMRQDSLDRATYFSLFVAGVAAEEIPDEERRGRNYNQLLEMLKPVANGYEAHASTWLYSSTLKSCTVEERDALNEILLGYLALLRLAADAGERTNLIDFGRAQIRWREELWPRLPSCSEALEIGAVIRESAGDTVEFEDDYLAWLPQGAIETLEDAISVDARLARRLEHIISDKMGGNSKMSSSLAREIHKPTCSAEAVDDIVEVIRSFQDELETAEAGNAWTGGLMSLIDARITWRIESKATLPNCRIKYDLGNFLSYDVLSYLSGGITVLSQLLNQGDWLQTTVAAIEEEPGAGDNGRRYSNNLRACVREELTRFRDNVDAYLSVIAQAPVIETAPDLFRQMNRILDWRLEEWVDLFACAETFEIGLLINQIASDTVAAHALEFVGISPILNPYIESRRRDINTLAEKVQEIPRRIDESETTLDQKAETPTLPLCTDDQLGTVLTLLGDFRKAPKGLIEGVTPESVQAYREFQSAWRQRIWAQIPACFEAVEIGLLMSRQFGDVPTIYALVQANVSEEDDPYMQSRYCDIRALGAWIGVLSSGDRQTMVDVFSCVGLEAPPITE